MSTGTDLESLRLEYENAKERLNHQSAQINELGRQGMKMVRVALVTVGLIATIATGIKTGNIQIGISPQDCVLFRGDPCGTIGQVAAFTVIAITGSTLTFASIIGPEVRGIGGTADPHEISQTIRGYDSEQQYLISRLDQYRDKISDNEEVINGIETLAALGGAGFALGLLSLVLIGYATIQGPLSGFLIFVIVLGLVVFYRVIGSRFPDSYLEAEGVGPIFYAILKWKRKTSE